MNERFCETLHELKLRTEDDANPFRVSTEIERRRAEGVTGDWPARERAHGIRHAIETALFIIEMSKSNFGPPISRSVCRLEEL